MDDQELVAEIGDQQAKAGKSDQASDIKARTNRTFEELKASILAAPQSPQSKPPSPTEIEAYRKNKILAALEVFKRQVGSKYQEAALSNWTATTERQRTVLQAAMDYCKAIAEHVAAGEGVVLYGPVGTGKDHLAVGIAKAACLAGLSVRWLKGQEWFGTLRDAIDGERTEREIFRGLECDLLVISDPFPPMGALTQYQASMLYRLTEERSSRGGAIVATINVADDAEADARLGAQTWDRLKDRCWLIKCEWRSFRKPSRIV